MLCLLFGFTVSLSGDSKFSPLLPLYRYSNQYQHQYQHQAPTTTKTSKDKDDEDEDDDDEDDDGNTSGILFSLASWFLGAT